NVETAAFYPAAFPLAIEVSGNSGRYGAIYDSNALSELWSAVSYSLGEALGTAELPEEITEAEFRSALDAEGVFLDYRNFVRVDVIIKWLGVSSVREHTESVRMFCLTPDQNSEVAVNIPLSLYYRDESGTFYKCSTAANSEVLLQKLGVYMPNGVYFAYESHFGDGILPYTLLPDAAPNAVTLTASNPLSVSVYDRDILDAFGMNPFSHNNSREGDVSVYVEESIRLMISPSGHIDFKSEREAADFAVGNLASAIESAHRLVSAFAPNDSMMLTSALETESGYEMTFSYYYNGIEIIAFEPGAKITVAKGVISDAVINMRSYSATEEAEPLMPTRQAFAAVKDADAGELRIVYVDSGETAVTPAWTIVP
ncbi:MAG: hypothetical protein LBN43_04650, partial [Oscillospiraceae bacterium]|nr:hypothetical protein [Oscillospiraceae bacterium]